MHKTQRRNTVSMAVASVTSTCSSGGLTEQCDERHHLLQYSMHQAVPLEPYFRGVDVAGGEPTAYMFRVVGSLRLHQSVQARLRTEDG